MTNMDAISRTSDAGPEQLPVDPMAARAAYTDWLADMSHLRDKIEEDVDYATDALVCEPDDQDYARHVRDALRVAWYWTERAGRETGKCGAGHWLILRLPGGEDALAREIRACPCCREFEVAGRRAMQGMGW